MKSAIMQWPQARSMVAVLLLALAGCAVQLAPTYDKALADGLAAASTDTMTLLASASQGTSKSTFPAREDKYNALIGKLEALALSSASRPMPKNKVTDAINKLMEKRGTPPLQDDDLSPPSAHAIQQIAVTMTKMRDTDKLQGVTALEVQVFKGQVVIYFDQAITYENFLQR